MSYST